MSSIIVSVFCSQCGEQFPFNPTEYRELCYFKLPKHCPKCLDERQHRPDVTLSRKELFGVSCKIASLPPAEWQQVQWEEKDSPAWHLVIKGERFGVSWRGRIDLWSVSSEPPKVGNVVRLSEMEVLKRIAVRKWSSGTRSMERQVPLALAQKENSDSSVEMREEKRIYVRIDPTDELPQGRKLVWIEAHTKTTLKGLGRQYHASLSGSPIWCQKVLGGYRSGRAHSVGWLAVVDPENPVIHSFREGGCVEETRYPAD